MTTTLADGAALAAVLLGGAAVLAAVIALPKAVRRLYPASETYAGFQAAARPELPCEGTCQGARPHEDHGDGTATCTGCGTPRAVPVPDPAA